MLLVTRTPASLMCAFARHEICLRRHLCDLYRKVAVLLLLTLTFRLVPAISAGPCLVISSPSAGVEERLFAERAREFALVQFPSRYVDCVCSDCMRVAS